MSLLKLLFTEKCSYCGERIEKAAQFCRHCGAGRADSWRKCTACGVSVAADAQFCWSCNANVVAQPRNQIFSDRWRRTPGVFATRATIETPQERLRNGIQVDDGTIGALYKDGVHKTELRPGYHAQTSFWDRLTGGGKTAGFVEAVIGVSDPVSSFVSLSDSAALFTKDYTAVEAAVMVKVQLADFGILTRRMLPTGTDTVRDDDLMLPHTARLAEVLRHHLSRLSVGELARSTELRHELEAALGAELPALLQSYGLNYCGIEVVRLDSPEIARVREAEGDITKTGRELAWSQVKRELEQSHKLIEIKDEFSFKEQLDQWTHEYTLTSLEREHIVTMRRIQLGEAQGLAQTHAMGRIQSTENDYEIELMRKDRDWEDEDDKRDLALLDQVRTRQLDAMEKIQKLKLEKLAAQTQSTVDLGQGLKDVPSVLPAGLTPDDNAQFTASMPRSANETEPFEVVVWMHLARHFDEVKKMASAHHDEPNPSMKTKAGVRVICGTSISVTLSVDAPDVRVDPQRDEIYWQGEITNACFTVKLGTGLQVTKVSARCGIYAEGLPLASFAFVINIRNDSKEPPVFHEIRPYRKAFASYASEDRDDVLARIQGMQKMRPELDVFFDVAKLRSNQDWRSKLQEAIQQCDVLYLFWSAAAAKSKWVRWEWRYALEQKGEQGIDPVPLVSPSVVKPPKELRHKHFNDWVLAYMVGAHNQSRKK